MRVFQFVVCFTSPAPRYDPKNDMSGAAFLFSSVTCPSPEDLQPFTRATVAIVYFLAELHAVLASRVEGLFRKMTI